jgi:hypothetical protein
MATASQPKPLISPSDMKVVERVLTMSEGYVLDFSNRTFDEFIGHELGLDATAPRFSVNGGSKANRLRTILHSLPASQQAKLLRAFLKHRDNPAFTGQDTLDDEWRETYLKIISSLEQTVSDADEVYSNEDAVRATSSAWTGRRTICEQVAIVRELAPVVLGELDELANLVESKRFNDPETADAIQCLRNLHRELGELIDAVDRGHLTRDAVAALERNRQRLAGYIKEGAKLTVVAPAMTFGIMHLLSWISGVPIDSTLLSTIYGSVLGHDVLKSLTKRSSLAG